MRFAAFLLFSCFALSAQSVRWAATTGDISLTGSAYTATIQQPANGSYQQNIDQIVAYCSVAASFTQSANGAPATGSASTVTPILPTNLSIVVPVNVFLNSNVGSGTAQGGIYHFVAGQAPIVFCLSQSCNNPGQVALGKGGTTANYSLTIASGVTGTCNITFYGRSFQQ